MLEAYEQGCAYDWFVLNAVPILTSLSEIAFIHVNNVVTLISIDKRVFPHRVGLEPP